MFVQVLSRFFPKTVPLFSVSQRSLSHSLESIHQSLDEDKAWQSSSILDNECDLSIDDLIKLLAEEKEHLKLIDRQNKMLMAYILKGYARIENNDRERTRLVDATEKFAIQNFATSVLNVADNLESFSKVDSPTDYAEAIKLLITLLQRVEMTEKQLSAVLKKFGVEKFVPMNELFNSYRHYAMFRIPDDSKPLGTVVAVLRAGYKLYGGVIRQAGVRVTT